LPRIVNEIRLSQSILVSVHDLSTYSIASWQFNCHAYRTPFTDLWTFCGFLMLIGFCRTMLCISAAYAFVRAVSVCHVRVLCRNE